MSRSDVAWLAALRHCGLALSLLRRFILDRNRTAGYELAAVAAAAGGISGVALDTTLRADPAVCLSEELLSLPLRARNPQKPRGGSFDA